jgi:Terminase small subunit
MSMRSRIPPVRKPNPLPINPSKPLSKPSREIFAQMVAQGVPIAVAYQRAGYSGGAVSRSQLRRAADVEARVSWLLSKRVEDDTKARHKAEKKIPDARERVIRELERVAFNDIRDLVQWDKRAVLDDDGQVVGFEDIMVVKPSRLMTPDHAASVRSVSTKAGQLKFETHDKLGALEKLAKILGLYVEPTAPPVSQSVTVNQLNFNSNNDLEAARRLAFALAKAAQMDQSGQLLVSHAVGEERKE